MDLFSIASGSSGNAICTGSEHTHVLLDAGISGKRIEQGLNTHDYTLSDIDAVLITHEHSDHIQGLGVIARKCTIPIYATKGTIRAIMNNKSLGQINPGLFYEVKPDTDFTVGDLIIHPFRISHDAADPVAYRVECKEKKVAVLTDLGVYDDYIIDNVRGLDAIVLEANHDIHMLEVGSYPYPLKKRILSEVGHLCNEASGQLLGNILHDNMKHIFLGHLSKENNYPSLAYETVKLEVSLGENPYKGSDFKIEVAPRDRVTDRVII
ncbi:MAG: MBL fold metallo-hydrolase [Lachnospiraceae bacterium]|nr:MBL fold metallo-hydrolase [Lachnospiraceae bacterium]